MSTLSNVYRIQRALDFLNNNVFWFCIGGITTEWPDPLNPPVEDPEATTITEIASFQRVTATDKFLVKLDPNGEIEYDNDIFTYVANENAYVENAHYMYCRAEFVGTIHPLVTFRQYGCFINLVPAAGYENYYTLLPEQVANVGTLVVHSNCVGHTREAKKREFLEFIIQF